MPRMDMADAGPIMNPAAVHPYLRYAALRYATLRCAATFAPGAL
ncbi:hypothetical protein [Sphingomonas sp. QA11]|nr:hypothetical protein [Sphingomonas sp. QA11]